jgi:uncharacterized protein YndB with AHSA1/START domain
MSEILHEIKIGGTSEQVFQALTTVIGIKSWQTPDVEGSGLAGSEWRFNFSQRPEFRWEIQASEPGKHVSWKCVKGPGNAVGTTVDFDISSADGGRVLLSCIHTGWPGTHGNYRKCNTTWGVLLHHLKQYVETGQPAPAFI